MLASSIFPGISTSSISRQRVAAVGIIVVIELQSSSRGRARRPGPLKVESAQMPGDIDHLADKKQSLHPFALHRLARKLIGVDAASGYFRFVVTLGARGQHRPTMQLAFELFERG